MPAFSLIQDAAGIAPVRLYLEAVALCRVKNLSNLDALFPRESLQSAERAGSIIGTVFSFV